MNAIKNVSMVLLGTAVIGLGTVIYASSAQAASFTQIRIGDVDGFGFGEGTGLNAGNSGSVNVDGADVLGAGDFLPDLNGNGIVSRQGDNFNNRSAEEKNNTFVMGSGFTNYGSTGSRFTDVSLSKGYNPEGEKGLRADKAEFLFDFFVDSADIIEGDPLFFNLIFGDYGVKPAKIKLTRADSTSLKVPLTVQNTKQGEDGLIQSAFFELAFDDLFTSSGTGFDGYLNVDFIAPNESYVAFDYVEISTTEIGTTPPPTPEPPASVPEPSSAFGLLAFGLVGAGWQLKRKLQGNVRTSSSSAD